MHKRILAIVTLLCAIPLLAFAAGTGLQQINTWVQSPGGSLKVDSYPAATSTSGSQFLSYSSSTSTNTVYITPNTNYYVNSLIFDGVPQSASSIATIVASGLPVTAGDSVWVSFLRNQLTFTVNGGANYIVFPSGPQPNVYSGPTYRVFEFIPAKGQFIASINPSSSVNMAYTTNVTLPAAANQKVIVTVSSITGAATLSATVGGTPSGSSIPITAATIAQTGRACDACHLAQGLDGSGVTIYSSWSTSSHKIAGVFCADCHVGANSGAHPGQVNTQYCATCHGGSFTINANFDPTVQDPHGYNGKTLSGSCVACHNVARNAGAGFVQDNSGVRAIIPEFSKTSHHIFNGVGIAPTDAQCVACHLEGTITGAGASAVVAVDTTVHMADAKIHLRNAATDADYAWDPQAGDSTSLTNVDEFCMSCHSATGATSPVSAKIQAYLNLNKAFPSAPAASATNPFGDLVSNSYDKQSRVSVVDVADQFATTNYSHHAVKGKRYTTRHSSVAVAAWIAYSTAGTGHSTTPTTPAAPRFNASTQKTLFDGNLFNANYVPLDTALAGATIGDDSQLHCGDCHTVGQWKIGSSTNQNGSATTVAIGAHGSNNEYMLRNTKGTDALHGLATFVCYNCHNDNAGGGSATGDLRGGYYAGVYWNHSTGNNGKYRAPVYGHTSFDLSGSSTQYGGGGACVGNTAGVAFTDFSSATHNFVSWASGFANAKTNYTGADLNNTTPFSVTSEPMGTQLITFNGAGTAIQVLDFYTGTSGVWLGGAAGNGNGGAYDANGTPVPGSGWTGIGRNNFTNGSIFGLGCMNCHNTGRGTATTGTASGNGGAFGGIHGGNNTYTTGFSASLKGAGTGALYQAGETQSTYRFMPGLGNYGYAPIGSNIVAGTTSGVGAATTLATPGSRTNSGAYAWEAWNGVGTSTPGGCYTNDYAKQNAGWSGCNHHNNSGSVPHGSQNMSPPNFGTSDGAQHIQSQGAVGRTLYY